MEYLNVSIGPVDSENTIYLCGETISIDCSLLHYSSHDHYTNVFVKTSEAMKYLVSQITVDTHINLFVEQIDPSTYGAIHGFLKSTVNKKENHQLFIKRLMVWVFDQKRQDCRAFGFYEV
ncbi:hypothetical protein EHV15_07055 [Paenibacillus oralis]|uniref:Uncharacterized protein n=1 Tax=Paenibacillus oralis TaxID=2490856 RepID=A0A3P3TX72_9BACL|nr:hypothetical protein [Paenibacillus oralis]RRJ62725.1 hypothetical protein EHV15_07055 [Paenibacillus oralis]